MGITVAKAEKFLCDFVPEEIPFLFVNDSGDFYRVLFNVNYNNGQLLSAGMYTLTVAVGVASTARQIEVSFIVHDGHTLQPQDNTDYSGIYSLKDEVGILMGFYTWDGASEVAPVGSFGIALKDVDGDMQNPRLFYRGKV